MITNSGSLRFDVFQGPFTLNDQLISFVLLSSLFYNYLRQHIGRSPFTDSFLFIPGVPLSVASQVVGVINGSGASNKRKRGLLSRLMKSEVYESRFNEWRRGMWERYV